MTQQPTDTASRAYREDYGVCYGLDVPAGRAEACAERSNKPVAAVDDVINTNSCEALKRGDECARVGISRALPSSSSCVHTARRGLRFRAGEQRPTGRLARGSFWSPTASERSHRGRTSLKTMKGVPVDTMLALHAR